jgi:Mitochondrial carrier protein
LAEFGGVFSLFRGMGAPLVAATLINAVIFGSYGTSSRLYDEYIVKPSLNDDDHDDEETAVAWNHDPWQKAMICGAFAGLVQCLIVCPMEHVKCRLQVQQDTAAASTRYQGSFHATRLIIQKFGFSRLYQGWWSTFLREVPAFGLYFVTYDYLKDQATSFFRRRAARSTDPLNQAVTLSHVQTWIASGFAGGCAGSLTWAIVYPVDVIKSWIVRAECFACRCLVVFAHAQFSSTAARFIVFSPKMPFAANGSLDYPAISIDHVVRGPDLGTEIRLWISLSRYWDHLDSSISREWYHFPHLRADVTASDETGAILVIHIIARMLHWPRLLARIAQFPSRLAKNAHGMENPPAPACLFHAAWIRIHHAT